MAQFVDSFEELYGGDDGGQPLMYDVAIPYGKVTLGTTDKLRDFVTLRPDTGRWFYVIPKPNFGEDNRPETHVIRRATIFWTVREGGEVYFWDPADGQPALDAAIEARARLRQEIVDAKSRRARK